MKCDFENQSDNATFLGRIDMSFFSAVFSNILSKIFPDAAEV